MGVQLATVAALLSHGARAQTPPEDDKAFFVALEGRDEESVWTAVRARLAQLEAADDKAKRAYCTAAGQAFQGGRPSALRGERRRELVRLHEPLVAEATPDFHEWFLFSLANYLGRGQDYDAALAQLDRIERELPDAKVLAFARQTRRIDYLTMAERLAEADQQCARGKLDDLPLDQQVTRLGQRTSLNLSLGRLELADQCMRTARSLAEQLVDSSKAAAQGKALVLQFDTERRYLDLLTAREQFDEARTAIAQFTLTRERRGAPLQPIERHRLAVHDANALYLSTQQFPERLPDAAEALQRLLDEEGSSGEFRAMLTIRAADVAVLQGRLAAAHEHLRQASQLTLSRQHRWTLEPVAARLARLAGADQTTLALHQERLRSVLDEMIAEWSAVATDADSTGFLRLGSRLRVVGELVAVTMDLHGAAAALQVALEAQRCTTLSRLRRVAPLSVATLCQQVLSATCGAIVFVPAWNESHVFAIDAAGVTYAALPRAFALRQLVGELRLELTRLDPAGGDVDGDALARVRRASRNLTTTLLPTAIRERMDGWQQVTVAGCGLLGGLPFECLELADGELLGERFAISTMASLPLAVELQHVSPGPLAEDALRTRCFGTLMPATEFARRNGIDANTSLDDATWRQLVARLPANPEVRVDQAATVTAFEGSCQHAADLTIVLAHGEGAAAGREPALAMCQDEAHPDGLLTTTRLRQLDCKGVVYVAACYAARGPRRMGDDEVSATIAGAFMRAGAHAVIASPTPLRLGLHLGMLTSFAEALRQGHPLADSLRRARRAVAGQDRRTAYLAAQISVFGWGGDPILVPGPSGTRESWVALSIAAALLTALFSVQWRRRRTPAA